VLHVGCDEPEERELERGLKFRREPDERFE
jgi:hypothetical protein